MGGIAPLLPTSVSMRFWPTEIQYSFTSGTSSCFGSTGTLTGCLLLHLRGRLDGQEQDVLLGLEEIKAATRWGEHRTPLGQPANDLVAVLHVIMGLEIARIRLGDLGWDPRIESRSTAVAYVDQCSPDVYRVHVSPLLGETSNHFGQPFEPQQCRHTTQLGSAGDYFDGPCYEETK